MSTLPEKAGQSKSVYTSSRYGTAVSTEARCTVGGMIDTDGAAMLEFAPFGLVTTLLMPRLHLIARRHPVLLSLLTCAALVLGLLILGQRQNHGQATLPLSIHGHLFTVELATTHAQWEHGLMDRHTLARDHGMLFVFPSEQPRAFWMKRTLVPLDILFFDDQQRLVGLHRDTAPCTGDPCPTYPSPAPARYVLELPAGAAQEIGTRVGDTFIIGNSG